MKKRALKTAVIALEVIALAAAAAAASLFYLYWRLGQGPVSLGLLQTGAEFAVERRLPPGFDAQIGALELQRASAPGAYTLRLFDLSITDGEGAPAAGAPEIGMAFRFSDLMAGAIGPKTITANGAELHIIRRENLNVDVPVIARPDEAPSERGLLAFLEGRFFRSAFESAEVSSTRITFTDVASGRSWSAPDAALTIRRDEEGLAARLTGDIDLGGREAALEATASYAFGEEAVDVRIEGRAFPLGDILSTFYGDSAAIVDAPVTGLAEIAFTIDGDVLSSTFDARLGEGHLFVNGGRRAISEIAWLARFDPLANRFTVERFSFDVEGVKGEIAGGVSISFGEDIRNPERISFNLSSDEIIIDVPNRLPAPLPVRDARIQGQYLLPERRLSISSLAAEFAGLSAAGSLTYLNPRPANGGQPISPGVIADIDFEGALDQSSLLSVWPKGLAMGARDWIEERLKAAHIDNLDFRMDLAPGAVADNGGLPDEAMSLTFDARDVTAYYIRQMTPLTRGHGRGVLRGNSFLLSVDGAEVGGVPIVKGEVSFPEFMPKWQPTYYRFAAEGDAQSMLALLDEAPLSLLSKVNLSASQFTGKANADVEIMRPNKRDVAPDEYGYKGTAAFEDMTISELIGDVELSGASGKVDLQTRSMTVAADAQLAGGAPITFQWRQNFYREDGPSGIDISGVFDSSTGDMFGVPTRQVLRGPVGFTAKAVGEFGDFESIDLQTDFRNATLMLDALGWRKPVGASAQGDLSLSFTGDGVTVENAAFAGDGVDVRGSFSFDANGALQKADFPRFFLGDSADLMLTADRDAMGALTLTAVGPYLNVGALIGQTLQGSGGQDNSRPLDWGPGIHLRARIDEVVMRDGVAYRDGALDIHRDAERLQVLDFSAFGANGDPLTVAMTLTGAEAGPDRAIEARTSAIGELMHGVFGLDSINGGEGSMRIALNQGESAGFAGAVEARRLQVTDAPLLARILSAGSLDGLVNLLNGDGIDFSYAYGEFDYVDGVLAVKDMRASGASVGITAQGRIGVGNTGTDLSGAVAPIYALNSMLGNAPIIGDILTGPRGEGVVAFNYRVSGDIANPSVFVNPLSALTPGIFREIFQPSRPNGGAAPDDAGPESPPFE